MVISDNFLRLVSKYLSRALGWLIGILMIELVIGVSLFFFFMSQPDRAHYAEVTRSVSPSGQKVLVAYFSEAGVMGSWFIKVDVEDQSGQTLIERLYVMDKCQFVTLHWWNEDLVDINGSTLRLGVDTINSSTSNPKYQCPVPPEP